MSSSELEEYKQGKNLAVSLTVVASDIEGIILHISMNLLVLYCIIVNTIIQTLNKIHRKR